jgi:hypothetical protein
MTHRLMAFLWLARRERAPANVIRDGPADGLSASSTYALSIPSQPKCTATSGFCRQQVSDSHLAADIPPRPNTGL